MGMFDSFLIRLKCPNCKKVDLQEIQTKAFANILANYHIGDIVENSPIGEFWLKEEWWCESCLNKKLDKHKYEHTIYLRLIDGLFIGVYSESEYYEQRKRSPDTYEIMQLYRQSAYKGTNRRTLIQRIYGLIMQAKTHWKNKESKPANENKLENFILPTAQNSDELVDGILQIIEEYKKQETELDDEPPW